MELETTEGQFFQGVDLYIWAVAGQELGAPCIQAENFNT